VINGRVIEGASNARATSTSSPSNAGADAARLPAQSQKGPPWNSPKRCVTAFATSHSASPSMRSSSAIGQGRVRRRARIPRPDVRQPPHDDQKPGANRQFVSQRLKLEDFLDAEYGKRCSRLSNGQSTRSSDVTAASSDWVGTLQRWLPVVVWATFISWFSTDAFSAHSTKQLHRSRSTILLRRADAGGFRLAHRRRPQERPHDRVRHPGRADVPGVDDTRSAGTSSAGRAVRSRIAPSTPCSTRRTKPWCRVGPARESTS